MKYRLMDLLACPICKNFPLKLYVFNVRKVSRDVRGISKPYCELYCGYHAKYVRNLTEFKCDECIKLEIESGLLHCSKCGRWYPIEDDIPRMLPDNLRNRDEDLKFLLRYRNRIPSEILEYGKPFNLSKGGI